MQYDEPAAPCPSDDFTPSQAQAYLDRLSWTKVPVQVIYGTEIRTASKALRIRLDPERLKREEGVQALRVTVKSVAECFALGEDAARRRLSELKAYGLVRGHLPRWPSASELFTLKPISKFAPRSRVLKKPGAWFHEVPRLLVTTLSDRALLVLLHLKHKSVPFWSESGEAQASQNEIAESLKMSRRDVSSSLAELKELLVVEEVGTSSYLVRDIHSGNADSMNGHALAPERDLRWLSMADCRNHELDRNAKVWFERFAAVGEPEWALDDHGVAFWRPSRSDEGLWCCHEAQTGGVLVPRRMMPDGNTRTSLPWGYVSKGLRPPWGNEETETKFSSGRHLASEIASLPSNPERETRKDNLASTWRELGTHVPPFLTREFIELAKKDREAASWLACWCYGALTQLGAATPIGDVRRGRATTPSVYAHESHGRIFAQLFGDVFDMVGITENNLPLAISALLDFMSAMPKRFASAMIAKKHMDGLAGPLFTKMMTAIVIAATSGELDTLLIDDVVLELVCEYNDYLSRVPTPECGDPAIKWLEQCGFKRRALEESPAVQPAIDAFRIRSASEMDIRCWTWRALRVLGRKSGPKRLNHEEYFREAARLRFLELAFDIGRRWNSCSRRWPRDTTANDEQLDPQVNNSRARDLGVGAKPKLPELRPWFGR